jgi:hypothetical protein
MVQMKMIVTLLIIQNHSAAIIELRLSSGLRMLNFGECA